MLVLPLFDRPVTPNLLQMFHERPTYHAFLARNDQYTAGQLTARDLGLVRFADRLEVSTSPEEEALPRAWDVDGHASAERLRATLAAFGVRWVIVAPTSRQDETLRYFGERVPVAWAERDPVDPSWAAFEIGDLGQENRIELASDRWKVAPADWQNRIGLGREPGWIVGTSATFFVRVSERQSAIARLPRLELTGLGLPPRLSDGATQEMTVYWDDAPVTTKPIALPAAGDSWSIPLPRDGFAPGWHWLRLEFIHELRPVDCIEGSDDERPLSLCLKQMAIELDFDWMRLEPSPSAATSPVDAERLRLVAPGFAPCAANAPGAVGGARLPGYVEGREAEFVFDLPALPAGAKPRLEIAGFGLPPTLKDRRSQAFNFYWNDRLLTQAPLEASEGHQHLSVPVPATLAAAGPVRVKVEFLRDIRPADSIPGSDDKRLLGYHFHSLDVVWGEAGPPPR